MAKLEDIDPTLDPIVQAAMLDDDEPETTEEVDEGAKSSQATNEENSEDQSEEDSSQEDPEDGNEVDDERSTEKESQSDEENEDAEDDPDKKLTRKEKREAKRQRYLDSIRKEGEQNSSKFNRELFNSDPNYKPLDYNESPELNVEDLVKDREQYGRNNFSRGAEAERYIANQENFLQSVEYEARMLENDPKFAFMNGDDPENYDPDRTAELNELFLELVGYDPNTNTVRRTDLSWEKFAKAEVARMERWQAVQEANITRNLAAQRSTSGIRPSGSPSKSLGKLKPGDISKMSQADFEKYEAEIDRQILAELGN